MRRSSRNNPDAKPLVESSDEEMPEEAAAEPFEPDENVENTSRRGPPVATLKKALEFRHLHKVFFTRSKFLARFL